jgi:hypothetical protein
MSHAQHLDRLQVVSRLLTTLSGTLERAEMAATDGYRMDCVEQAIVEADALAAAVEQLVRHALVPRSSAADDSEHEPRDQDAPGRRARRRAAGLRRVAARISRASL